MGGELTQTDLRPIFFRVIEAGQKSGILTAERLEELRKEGAEMTVRLAEKHYSVVSQAHLWQSAYNLCGILSLALTEKFGADMEGAARLVRTEGLVKVFRLGWSMLQEAIEAEKAMGNERSTLEREICEDISAEPMADWSGYAIFQKRKLSARLFLEEDQYLDWVIERWCRKDDPELKDWFEQGDRVLSFNETPQRKREILNTLFFSLLISEKPFAPLKNSDLDKIIWLSCWDNQDVIEEANEVSSRLLAMEKQIPSRWVPLFSRDSDKFVQEIAPKFAERIVDEGVVATKTWMQNFLYSNVKIDDEIRKMEATKKKRTRKKGGKRVKQ